MQKTDRIGLFIYLYYNRDARKVNKFGDYHYHSKRFRYVLLYVNQADAEEIAEQMKTFKFVKSVRLSHQDEIDRDFVGNLTR